MGPPFKRLVSIDPTKVGSTDSSNFPVEFSVIDPIFKSIANGGHVASASGFDMRPYLDFALTIPLDFELERYVATTGEVIMWVKVPTLSHSVQTTFYIRYDDASLTTDGSNAVNTFSNGFDAIYHFKDGTTLNISDAIGPFTVNGAPVPTAGTGQIDGGAAFASASSQYLETTGNGPPGNNPATALTLSGWAKATSFPNDYNPCLMNRGVAAQDYYGMYVRSADGKLYSLVYANTVLSYNGTGSIVIATGSWYYFALTYDNVTGLKAYVNAVLDNTVAPNGGAQTAGNAMAMGRQRSTGTRYWNGLLDEMRHATVVRSVDWITAEYNNQFSPSTFLTVGPEQPA